MQCALVLALLLSAAGCIDVSSGIGPSPSDDEPAASSGPAREPDPVFVHVNVESTQGVERVVAEVQDGLVILEGDIVLGTVEEIEQAAMERSIVKVVRQWEIDTIPYAFDDSEAIRLTLDQKEAVRLRLGQIEAHVPFTFQEIGSCTPGSQACIRFQHNQSANDGGPCNSGVGPNASGGGVNVNLSNNCVSNWQRLVHEIGHALGLPHEQNHPEHDDEIIYSCEHRSGVATQDPVTGEWSCTDSTQWTIDEAPGEFATVAGFDWDSVMLYMALTGRNAQDRPIRIRRDVPLTALETTGPDTNLGTSRWTEWATDVDWDEHDAVNPAWSGFFEQFGSYRVGDFGCGQSGCAPGITDLWRAVPLGDRWRRQVLYADQADLGWQTTRSSSYNPSRFLFGDVDGDGLTDVVIRAGSMYRYVSGASGS